MNFQLDVMKFKRKHHKAARILLQFRCEKECLLNNIIDQNKFSSQIKHRLNIKQRSETLSLLPQCEFKKEFWGFINKDYDQLIKLLFF